MLYRFFESNLEVLLDTIGSQRSVITDGDGELDVVLLTELVQPIQEVLGIVIALAANDLGQAINKDMGNVVVAGVQAADKALQGSVVGDVILAGLDQTNLIADIESQLITALNADDIAVLGLDGVVDHVDHLLGLTGALLAHDNSNHVYHSLGIITIREQCSSS